MFGALFHPREPLAAAYRAATRWRPSLRTPIDRLRFVVLDAETSGFAIGTDHLLTLACVDVSEDQIRVSAFRSWLLRQDGIAVNAAVAVHGILPSESADGRPEKEVLAEFLPLVGGAVLVGHHVGFDAGMLDHALRRHFRTRLRNPLVDTGRLAMAELEAFRKTGYPGQRPPSLDEVCANLGLPMHDRHTASGDTFTTAQLFLLLAARARRRLGRPPRFHDLAPRWL
jgi:DNA polymerase-3 subunit epsilon